MYEQERRLIRMIRAAEELAAFCGEPLFIARFPDRGWVVYCAGEDDAFDTLEEALENFLPGEFPHCERDGCCD